MKRPLPDTAPSACRHLAHRACAAAFGVLALALLSVPAAAEPVIEAGTSIMPAGPPELRAASPAATPSGGGTGQSPNGGPEAESPAGSTLADLPAGPLPAQPVVVELFTAQGCSSCPPADALLADMAGRPDLLVLSFHVDYWDYLGWQDGFAQPAFTARQKAYARAFHERGLYTPQMIIGGTDTLITPRPADLDALIEAQRGMPPALAARLERRSGRQILTLTPQRMLSGPAEVQLVRYLPQRQVPIEAGENAGRRMSYYNIVMQMDKLSDWDGHKQLRLTISAPTAPADKPAGDGTAGQPDLPIDTRHAIIVQQTGPGPILAAIRLD